MSYYPPQEKRRTVSVWTAAGVGLVSMLASGAVAAGVIAANEATVTTTLDAENQGISKSERAAYLDALDEATSWALKDVDENDRMRAGRRACSLYSTSSLGDQVALETVVLAYDGKNPLPGVFGEGEDAGLAVAEVLGAATATLCPEHQEQAMSEAQQLIDLGL